MTTTLETLAAQYAAEELRVAEFRADQLEYELWELRAAKYTDDQKKDLLAKGKAIANADGDPSYPVADIEDITKAIKAVGRGGADHNDIRLHIIKGAVALGPEAEALIPDNWDRTDGSLKVAPAATSDTVVEPEVRAVSAYIDEATAETVRSEHTTGYRALPEDPDERAELEEVRTDIIAPLYAYLTSLSDEERFLTWANYEPALRDALVSFQDIENAIENALRQKLGDGNDGCCDLYVCDATADWAVFRSYTDPPGHGLWKVTYSLATDGEVTFNSQPCPVIEVTTYQEVAAPVVDITTPAVAPAGRSAVTLDDLEDDLTEIRTGVRPAAVEVPEERADGVVTLDDLDADLVNIRNRKS